MFSSTPMTYWNRAVSAALRPRYSQRSQRQLFLSQRRLLFGTALVPITWRSEQAIDCEALSRFAIRLLPGFRIVPIRICGNLASAPMRRGLG
jgi:hypothetical protein